MARGRPVVVVQAALVLAYAAAGSHAALGQTGFERPGASVSLPARNLLGLISTTPVSVNLNNGGAAVVLPGVSVTSLATVAPASFNAGAQGATVVLPSASVSNLATVSAASVSLSSGSANVVLPGASIAGLATVTAASVNLSKSGASVVLPGATVTGLAAIMPTALNVNSNGVTLSLPNVDVAGISVSTTPLNVNLSGQGPLLNLPAATAAGPGQTSLPLLGYNVISDTVNQLSPLTQLLATVGTMEAFAPVDRLVNGLAFGDEAASECAVTDASALTPPSGANLGMWNAAVFGRTEHDGFQVTAADDGAACGTRLPFETHQSSRLPGVVWDASSAFGFKRGTLHVGFSGGASEMDTQIKASPALRDAGITQGGAARLTSWSFGAFSLLTGDGWYAGTAAGGAWGRTESQNFVLGSASDYDTSAMVVAGFIGTIVPLSDNLRFDLRGTLSYQRTVGDAHADTLGIVYGDHMIEAADAVLSGRLFGVFRQNDLIWRPFLQAGVTQHLRYNNNVEIDGIAFTLQEADTTIFAAGGLDLEINRALQLSVGVRHDYSRDLESTTGRLGFSLRLN